MNKTIYIKYSKGKTIIFLGTGYVLIPVLYTNTCLIFYKNLRQNIKIPLEVILIFKKVKGKCRASLVAQWLRVCLLTQGTQVRALVWEDPTCRGSFIGP